MSSNIPTFNPPKPPTPGSTKLVKKDRILIAKFGDGYEQRAADGINQIMRTAILDWDNLTINEAYVIDNFFDALLGWYPFFYQVPGDNQTYLWVVDNTSSTPRIRTPINGQFTKYQVAIRQVYDFYDAYHV